MKCGIGPFDSQRAFTKHMQQHQRAFDEEELRGKGAFTQKLKSTPTKSKQHSQSHSRQNSDGFTSASKRTSEMKGKKKKDDESGSEGELPMISSAKKKSKVQKQQVIIDDEGSISEEERHQAAIRREQKRLNIAAAASNQEESKEPEEEEVKCCLCHAADSDETNQIVMCDGPCGQ